MSHLRFCAPFALLCAALLPGPAVAASTSTDPAMIKALAADAYLWGLGPEFVWRFAQYNTIIGAKFNAFKYGQVPAAWNNEATNAGDASVVYIGGFVNFDKSPALVLTVPPTTNQYYIVAYIEVTPIRSEASGREPRLPTSRRRTFSSGPNPRMRTCGRRRYTGTNTR